MAEERRKQVRRQADRELLTRFLQLSASGNEEEGKRLRHLRRHAIRHQCSVDIALLMAYASGNSDTWNQHEHRIKGRILDLSEQGCSLFTKQNLDMGQRASVVIHLERGGQIRGQGIVRWTKSVPERHGFASGVQFERLSEKEARAISGFLLELDRTIGL